MQTSIYEGLKGNADNSTLINDFLVVEAPLEIQINKEPFTVIMRTPGNDFQLIRGLLYVEDIYKNNTPLELTIIENHKNGFSTINVTIPSEKIGKGYLNKRSLLSVSSCGICGKQKLDDFNTSGKKLQNTPKLDLQKLSTMFATMRTHQHTFELTGGSHAAAVFNKKYNLITLQEDIGRHNAVDKCIGTLLNQKQLKEGSFLLVSGRVSYEIISKAFFAKIGTIVAISACSSLAVDYAKEFGICLIGFSRNEKATLYAGTTLSTLTSSKAI